ncbi:MAG: flagellar export chaperone FliS [Ferrimicrobium sp.]
MLAGSGVRRRAYTQITVETASPAGQLMILLDELAASLDRAKAAFRVRSLEEIHRALVHSQGIVALLSSALREDIWEGAGDLRVLYAFVIDRLVRANLAKNQKLLEEAETVLRPLMATWRQAAELVRIDSED